MSNLKNIILYGTANKDDYYKVRDSVVEATRVNLVTFSSISSVAMAAMLFASFVEESLVKNRPFYGIALIIGLFIFWASRSRAMGNVVLIRICEYVFVGMLMAFGIILGAVLDANNMSVSFPILVFAVPLLFTDVPLRMGTAIVAGHLVFIAIASHTQPHDIFTYNLTNIIPYGLVGLIVNTYMMKIKFERYVFAQKNKFLSESDQLTGLLNRRSYEQHMEKFREYGCKGIKVCMMDINGLKVVNDKLGHHAGDELIKGAAKCIENTLSQYGRCYRTGGDEYVAILDAPSPDEKELIQSLVNSTECWKGTLVSSLSISIGIAAYEEGMNIDALVQMADKKMYEYKSDYYRKTGVDRRRN